MAIGLQTKHLYQGVKVVTVSTAYIGDRSSDSGYVKPMVEKGVSTAYIGDRSSDFDPLKPIQIVSTAYIGDRSSDEG